MSFTTIASDQTAKQTPDTSGRKDKHNLSMDVTEAIIEKAILKELPKAKKKGDLYDLNGKLIKAYIMGYSKGLVEIGNRMTAVMPEKDMKQGGFDIALFSRIESDYNTVYIGGWLSLEEFIKLARYQKSGAILRCGFPVKNEGFACSWKRLRPIKELGD